MMRPQAARRAAWRPPAARRPQCAVKWDRNLKPKLAIMRQCTSVTDRRTDGLASWHKREMYILHLAVKSFSCHLHFYIIFQVVTVSDIAICKK